MSSEANYTGHLHDPEKKVTWGTSWLRFAIAAALLIIVFWAAL